jgi:hypothetical protein
MRSIYQLSVLRDGDVCDQRALHLDVRRILAPPSDAERGQWLVDTIEAEATRCFGCRTFVATLRPGVTHDRESCLGTTLIHELVELTGVGYVG